MAAGWSEVNPLLQKISTFSEEGDQVSYHMGQAPLRMLKLLFDSGQAAIQFFQAFQQHRLGNKPAVHGSILGEHGHPGLIFKKIVFQIHFGPGNLIFDKKKNSLFFTFQLIGPRIRA